MALYGVITRRKLKGKNSVLKFLNLPNQFKIRDETLDLSRSCLTAGNAESESSGAGCPGELAPVTGEAEGLRATTQAAVFSSSDRCRVTYVFV